MSKHCSKANLLLYFCLPWTMLVFRMREKSYTGKSDNYGVRIWVMLNLSTVNFIHYAQEWHLSGTCFFHHSTLKSYFTCIKPVRLMLKSISGLYDKGKSEFLSSSQETTAHVKIPRTMTADVIKDTAVLTVHVSTARNCLSVQQARSWWSLVTKETLMTLKYRVQYKWLLSSSFLHVL